MLARLLTVEKTAHVAVRTYLVGVELSERHGCGIALLCQWMVRFVV